MSVDQIVDEALKLSPEDRAKVLERLSDSVPQLDDDPELEAILDRRWDEIASGKVKTIPLDEVIAGAKAAIREVREKRQVPS